MSWDNQSNCFLNALADACYTALDAQATSADYNTSTPAGKPIFGINSDHKVTINVGDEANIRFDWTVDDGATVAGILGFSASANLEVNGSEEVADYPHAYGWYASEEGQLFDHLIEDAEDVLASQSRALSGQVTTQELASRFRNYLDLRHLTKEDTFSGETDYAAASSDPYSRNRGLECWWRHARGGVEFRVYERSTIDTSLAEERGTPTAASTGTTITVASKTWETDPQEHAGKLILIDSWYGGYDMRWYITSHTADVVTVPNQMHNEDAADASVTAYIFDQRYRTYVVNLSEMSKFEPRERPKLGTYDITIPLYRYEA